MAWKLANSDRSVTLDLIVDGNGNLNGTVTFRGLSFPVSGGWSASGSIPGRNASAFSLSGRTTTLPDVPTWIAASGIMIGGGDSPQRINLQASLASGADGTRTTYSGSLLPAGNVGDQLDQFDHVVVLMLENRSFDNLLGYMYPQGVPATAPLGKTFEGVTGKSLSNPIPPSPDLPRVPPPVPVTAVPAGDNGLLANYFQPYPDPGETYDHVGRQLFFGNDGGKDQYNVPTARPLPTPTMSGFVADYIANYGTELKGKKPTYADYSQIMQCYTPEQVPILTTLASKFSVFDHWFCAVPSQTWCNRAFWNSGTSWGHVNNGGSLSEAQPWASSVGPTIFSQIRLSQNWLSQGPVTWNVYMPSPAFSLTHLVHFFNLDQFWSPFFSFINRFFPLAQFFTDCAAGSLPSYSFLEPEFFTPNNDMHPNSGNDQRFGKGSVGSVLLGEHLIWQVYEAVRKSPAADRTLLVITFDEHGGCYDHVPPPGTVTPPDLTGYTLEAGFPCDRLGVRVPTIMVSSHIAENTVVNTPMHHGSFLKTVSKKWDRILPGYFPPLTARVATAPEFTEVFTVPPGQLRSAASWPALKEPSIPAEFFTTDFSSAPLGGLERSIVAASAALPPVTAARTRGVPLPDPASITTVGEAKAFLEQVEALLRDAAAQPTDAAAQPTDAAAQPTDAAAQPTDAAAQPTDAAAQPTDAAPSDPPAE